MVEAKKTVTLSRDREAVLVPELEERPPLGPIVAIVKIRAPWWPGAKRKNTIAFLDGLVAAFRIRARDELDLRIVAEGTRVVVRRLLPSGEQEVRFERANKKEAVLYCDRRELDNLHALGLLDGARVTLPAKAKNGDG